MNKFRKIKELRARKKEYIKQGFITAAYETNEHIKTIKKKMIVSGDIVTDNNSRRCRVVNIYPKSRLVQLDYKGTIHTSPIDSIKKVSNSNFTNTTLKKLKEKLANDKSYYSQFKTEQSRCVCRYIDELIGCV